MCIFSKPVVSVSDTSIFARLAEGDWQYLVYQMKFATRQLNAMILPIPIASQATEESVRFISLEKYNDFFEDLADGFPVMEPTDSALGSRSLKSSPSKNALKVQKVGAFVASFVPSIEDFSRLDKRFIIPRESWDKIPTYADYGFAVFQLASLEGKPHPMAFKFKTRCPDQIFFPTVHIHDGEVHEREEFDHTLFLQHQAFDDSCGKYKEFDHLDSKTGYVRSRWPAKEFSKMDANKGIVDGELLVHRTEMQGELDNRDVLVEYSSLNKGRDGQASGAWNTFRRSIPLQAAVGLLGLTWLFQRRNEVSNADQTAQACSPTAESE